MRIRNLRIGSLALISLMMATNLSGQLVKVLHKEKIDIEKRAFYPVLNDKGNQLLFTGANYNGLKLVDLSTGKITQISESDGAGFEPVFEVNTGNIIHRETRFVERRKYQSVQRYNPSSRQRTELVPSTRNLKTTLPSTTRSGIKNVPEIRVYSNAQSVIISNNGVEKLIKPFPESEVSGYIWASLSPDKKRILFYATGKGTCIVDFNGKVISFLGNLQAPRWYTDSLVVGMDARNNEYNYTSSRIQLVSADGKTKQYLTGEGEMAMYPTASGQAGKIAYNTYNGDIHLLTVKPE